MEQGRVVTGLLPWRRVEVTNARNNLLFLERAAGPGRGEQESLENCLCGLWWGHFYQE